MHTSRDTAHAQWLQTHCQWYPMVKGQKVKGQGHKVT